MADIMKLFDQIVRPIVYMLARLAGMPPKVLDAYRRYPEGMKVYDGVAGGLGSPYWRRCGNPQGCPFSMMIIALVMRPWTIIVAKEGCKPRILADDMEMHAIGPGHAQKFHKAYGKSIEYLVDMGAKMRVRLGEG